MILSKMLIQAYYQIALNINHIVREYRKKKEKTGYCFVLMTKDIVKKEESIN